jgi:hypothetical protein
MEAPPAPLEFAITGIAPNPLNGAAQINFTLPHLQAGLRVALFDLSGREAMRIPLDIQGAAGRHSIIVDASGLSSGIYLCRLESAIRQSPTVRLVVLK